MTLDEAIKHVEEVMVENLEKTKDRNASDPIAINCFECADEHRQIAEWLKELKQLREQTGWIPIKFRSLTDEEQEKYPDYCYIADCQMPDDGEEIFVSTKYGTVDKDVCEIGDGYYLDSGYDWQTDIVAWQPLPKPYKGE